MNTLSNALGTYRQLVAKTDELCHRITGNYASQITCSAGCDACCRDFSLFPVEAAALALALATIPAPEVERIRARARHLERASCPLLDSGLCLLYNDRPIICRTHGLPVLTRDNNDVIVDFCRENFRAVTSIPGSAVIDLDVLNTSLIAVNGLFLDQSKLGHLPDRITIRSTVCLDIGAFAQQGCSR